jgi:hypothetical protein
MAGDTVARSVSKFIYIRVGGQIRWIYPPLNKPKPLAASFMKKKSQLLNIGLVIILISACGKNQTDGTNKLKIKSKLVLREFISNQKVDNSISDTLSYTEYDSFGNVTFNYLEAGDIVDNSFYLNNYNKLGQLISKYARPKNGFSIHLEDTFFYNDKQLLIREIKFGQFKNDTIEIISYEYNDIGQLTQKDTKSTHAGDYSISYKYEANILTEEKGDFHRRVYSYDPKGQLLKESLFYNSNDTVGTNVYRYDATGRLFEKVEENKDGRRSDYSFILYDKNGLIKEKTQGNMRLLYRYEFF